MTTYTCISRHSERIDEPNPTLYDRETLQNLKQSWLDSQRHRENPYDPYLTEHGKYCAQEEGHAIIKQIAGKTMSFHIVSSPFTRCIESAGAIQQVLKQQYETIFPICIEYGLAEPMFQFTIPIWNPESQSFSYQHAPVERKGNNMDDKMHPEQIQQRFPQFTFDLSYQSIQQFVPRRVEDFPTFADRIIHITNQIVSRQPPNTYLICMGHADMIRFTYNYYVGRPLTIKHYNQVWSDQGYGACLLLENKRPITFYPSNTEYCKGLPMITLQQQWIEHMKTAFVVLFPLLFAIYILIMKGKK